jgi:hypothetical protein
MDNYGQRLASLDPETGQRPSSRLGHAGNARQLVNRLKYEDETRMYRYTKIQGLMDGNPPWNGQKLVDIGQGHRANLTSVKAKASLKPPRRPTTISSLKSHILPRSRSAWKAQSRTR